MKYEYIHEILSIKFTLKNLNETNENHDIETTRDVTLKENKLTKIDIDLLREHEEMNLLRNKIEEQNNMIKGLQINIDHLETTNEENDAFIKRLLKD